MTLLWEAGFVRIRSIRGEREGVSSNDKDRLLELERENARLRMERELLKRAVAFWVKESNE